MAYVHVSSWRHLQRFGRTHDWINWIDKLRSQQKQQPHYQSKEEWHVSPLPVAPNAGMNGGGCSLTLQMAQSLLQSNTVGRQGDLRNNSGGFTRPLLIPPELPMRRFDSPDSVNNPAG